MAAHDPLPDEAAGSTRTYPDEPEPVNVASPIAGDPPQLLDQSYQWMDRWNEIQTGFVDEPREAIENADALVAEILNELTATFAAERARLESRWSAGTEPSTEDLRVALQRYRSFFNRLLAA